MVVATQNPVIDMMCYYGSDSSKGVSTQPDTAYLQLPHITYTLIFCGKG